MAHNLSLKCVVEGHSSDVRVVTHTPIPANGIITGSRDNTVKVWAPLSKERYQEAYVFRKSPSFIASLCMLPKSDQYPKGLILAGSNDCSIYGFTTDSIEPVMKLLGHAGPVCSLSYGPQGFLVSGSWDKTARVWAGQQCTGILEGHLETVWTTAVFSSHDGILTGSADATIRLWRAGACEREFHGHKDCVRGLVVLNDSQFLSCSNDTTIRLWLINGECAQTFTGHTDYIYSIALLNEKGDFVTCGEDQSIKVWKDGICIQTIVTSAKSLWSVACMTNGDVAVGASNGKIYVFERVDADHFERMSDIKDIQLEGNSFNDEGDINAVRSVMEDDFLSRLHEQECIVIYQYGNNMMYTCSYKYETGLKIDKKPLDRKMVESAFYRTPCDTSVPGVSSASQQSSDYMFEVEIENVMYKLPYNKEENPWEVASKFVSERNLPVDYVDQIVNFIMKNTAPSTNEYYPKRKYCTYLKVNVNGLKKKLLELCEQLDEEYYVSPSDVNELMALTSLPSDVTPVQLNALNKVMSWPDEFLFPVLDLLRIAVNCPGLNSTVTSHAFINQLLTIYMTTEKNVNKILIQKVLCNMFEVSYAEDILISCQDKIFEAIKENISKIEPSIEKSASSLLLNFSITSHKNLNYYKNYGVDVEYFCQTVMTVTEQLTDVEAIFRMLMAIGTAITRNPIAIMYFRSLNASEMIKGIISRSFDERIQGVGRLVLAEI